jgi:hypothetical protein
VEVERIEGQMLLIVKEMGWDGINLSLTVLAGTTISHYPSSQK